MADWSPSHSSIDTLNIVTPNLADYPLTIKHICLEYYYTKLGQCIYIEQYIYTNGGFTPPVN